MGHLQIHKFFSMVCVRVHSVPASCGRGLQSVTGYLRPTLVLTN